MLLTPPKFVARLRRSWHPRPRPSCCPRRSERAQLRPHRAATTQAKQKMQREKAAFTSNLMPSRQGPQAAPTFVTAAKDREGSRAVRQMRRTYLKSDGLRGEPIPRLRVALFLRTLHARQLDVRHRPATLTLGGGRLRSEPSQESAAFATPSAWADLPGLRTLFNDIPDFYFCE